MLTSINPNHTFNPYDKNFKGTNMNCGLTTIAEELTMRGEKVHARLETTGMLPEQLGSYFKGMHSNSISNLNLGDFGDARNLTMAKISNPLRGVAVKNKMSKHVLSTFPKGSRGNVYVPNINGNHYISFEHLGDRVRFDNPQYPKMDLTSWFSGVVTSGSPGADRYGGIRFTRLDDLTINTDLISEVVTKMKDDLSSTFDTNVIKGENFVMNATFK